MKRHRALKMIGIGIIVIALFFVLGYVVMALWNWLMPSIFGLHTITYWQAYGLLILSKILFGGIRGGRGRCGDGRKDWRNRMAGRWASMTPEERAKVSESWRGFGCCAPPAESKAEDHA